MRLSVVIAAASAEEIAEALAEHPTKAAVVAAKLTRQLGPSLVKAADARVEAAMRAAEADPVGTIGRMASAFLDGADK